MSGEVELHAALQNHVRDLRTVLEAMHQSHPWIDRDTFKEVFIECELGDLYDDMFGATDD